MIKIDFSWLALVTLLGALLGWWCTGLARRYAHLLLSAADYVDGDRLLARAVALSSIEFTHKSDAGLAPARASPWLALGSSGLMAGFVFIFYGRYGQSLPFLIVVWALAILLILAIVDAKTSLLPDALTFPLLWLGLALAWLGGQVSLHSAVAGAMLGYGFLYTLFLLFKLIRKTDGMGYGDFKLLAALGAWVGELNVLYVLLMACLTGLLFALGHRKRLTFGTAYPFGPFLAASGVAVMALAPEVHSYF